MIESDFNSVSVLKVDGEGGGGGNEKKPSYFRLYWFFNRDPYKGLLQSPHTIG